MVQSVYLAGGLTGAPASYKNFLRDVATVIGITIPVNLFFSLQVLVDPSIVTQNLYGFNKRQVLSSDAIVAFCDYPSTGMGFEVHIAHEVRKRIIFLHKDTAHPSRMVVEFAELYEYPVLKYANSDLTYDIAKKILVKLKE